MSDVFDLDALANEDEPFRFLHDGETYELPADVPLEVVAILDEGRLDDGLTSLLGPDQAKRLAESPTRFGVNRFVTLFEAYAKHLGIDSLGGSLASTASSSKTAVR